MTYTRINPKTKVTTHSASSVTIAAGSNYYANLGAFSDVSGYVPVGVVFNLVNMSNFSALVPGLIQTNGTALWSRIYNSYSAAATGSWTASVYWIPAP